MIFTYFCHLIDTSIRISCPYNTLLLSRSFRAKSIPVLQSFRAALPPALHTTKIDEWLAAFTRNIGAHIPRISLGVQSMLTHSGNMIAPLLGCLLCRLNRL